jgi:peroxiredoxin
MKEKLVFRLLLFSIASYSQNKEIDKVILKTVDGKDFKIETAANAATVIVFLLPDCPASQNYTGTLNQFLEKYVANKIAFCGVFPAFVKKEDILEFQKEYHIKFPLVIDDKQSLAKALSAHVAPGVFVLDQRGAVVYSGRIDDWMYAVGKKRTVITHHELKDALDAIAQGKKVPISKTQAVGCIID